MAVEGRAVTERTHGVRVLRRPPEPPRPAEGLRDLFDLLASAVAAQYVPVPASAAPVADTDTTSAR